MRGFPDAEQLRSEEGVEGVEGVEGKKFISGAKGAHRRGCTWGIGLRAEGEYA